MKLYRLLIPLGILAIGATAFSLYSASAATDQLVYAHRGGTSAFVENTRESFANAAAHGSLLWETDVRFSRTNFPVLLHDADLRNFGCPTLKIASVSGPTARKCAADNGQSISTLHEFVTDLSATDAQAMIELKTVPTAAQWKILDTRISAMKNRIIIESFSPTALTAASQRGYDTAYLTKTAVHVPDLPSGTDWYAPEWSTLTEAQINAMHAVGVKVVAWTPDCDQWPNIPDGVDALISNDLPSDCH